MKTCPFDFKYCHDFKSVRNGKSSPGVTFGTKSRLTITKNAANRRPTTFVYGMSAVSVRFLEILGSKRFFVGVEAHAVFGKTSAEAFTGMSQHFLAFRSSSAKLRCIPRNVAKRRARCCPVRMPRRRTVALSHACRREMPVLRKCCRTLGGSAVDDFYARRRSEPCRARFDKRNRLFSVANSARCFNSEPRVFYGFIH